MRMGSERSPGQTCRVLLAIVRIRLLFRRHKNHQRALSLQCHTQMRDGQHGLGCCVVDTLKAGKSSGRATPWESNAVMPIPGVTWT